MKSKFVVGFFLVLALALVSFAVFAAPARAADMSTKAPTYGLINAPCTMAGCSGFFLGAEVSGAGSGIGVLNAADLSATSAYMGATAGYQFYNGVYWLGVKGSFDYAVSQQNPNIGGKTLTSSNKFFAFEGIEVGGPLATLFGVAALALPGPMANAVPTVLIGACQNGALNGYCVGAGAHFFIPQSRFTIDVQYLNAQYGSTNVSAIPGVPATISTENRGSFGFSYHF
jgi:hypothetical protein